MSTTEACAHVCTTPQTPLEYVNSLPAWDGVPRLDTWLPHVLGVSPESSGMYRMQYLSFVGHYWLQGMVGRALQPGCKFDYLPVLEGQGGTRKSTLLEALAGKEFFSDSMDDLSYLQPHPTALQSTWIHEIAELSALSKGDKAYLKQFITANKDSHRVPYSTEVHYMPRQFVVVGTTNDDNWRSQQMDLRFWPVPVPYPINISWVSTNRDQLFAEAKARIDESAEVVDLHGHPGMPWVTRRWGSA